jgi:hypothetical protein
VMNPRRLLLIVARLLALAAIAQAVAIWIFCRSSWTPIERHYLSAYFWSSLQVVGPSSVEVRLIWKTGRHRKQQLATDNDAVSSDDGTVVVLSQSAREAGWKALIEGPPQQVPTDAFRPVLTSLAFEGQSFSDLLLLPELSALAVLCTALGTWYLLTGFFRALITELAWRRRFSDFQELSASLAQSVYSGLKALHRTAMRRVGTHSAAPRTTVAVIAPEAKPASFALPLFGVYNGTATGGYLWNEKDAIE